MCLCAFCVVCVFSGQVPRPLDFSTIKKRQKKGRYAKLGVSTLWEDVTTVYGNAQLYNQVSVTRALLVGEGCIDFRPSSTKWLVVYLTSPPFAPPP